MTNTLSRAHFFLALAVAVRARQRIRPWIAALFSRETLPGGWTALEAGLLFALLAVPIARLWSAGEGGSFTYDSLVCHLHFPAVWMYDERISIVPTVFGDVAAAYAPSNAELVYDRQAQRRRRTILGMMQQSPGAQGIVRAERK